MTFVSHIIYPSVGLSKPLYRQVGKLNSPFEVGISENEGPSWSKTSSRNASRGCSRRVSCLEILRVTVNRF